MKGMARTILFSSIIVATAAMGDRLSTAIGEADAQADANSMPAEPQATAPTVNAESMAPGSTDGAAQEVAANSGAAELQPGDSVQITPSSSTEIVVAAPPPPPVENVVRRAPARPAYVATNIASAFPGSAPEGYFLPANVTHASRYPISSVAAASAFPGSANDTGIFLVARSTYADTHLASSVQVGQQEQRGAETGN
jgi:hypothetical protein